MSIRCGQCQGDGWIVVAEHACNGDERMCQSKCPVEAQEVCPSCDGEGKYADRE
jgi:DnaJ-class molecular chaperone